MIAIWSWLIQTWNALTLAIAHNLVFYIIAVPVIAAIAWLTLPYFKPPFGDEDESHD
jgi:hypothetical protein